MDDFGYLPDGAPTNGDARYGNYSDATATWPGARYADGSPADYPPRQANGMPWPPPADEGAIRGYPPRVGRDGYGYPSPGSGPMPRYQPGMRPPNAYSGPMPVYRPDSGPMRAYRPDSGPMPVYRGPGHWSTDTALLAGPGGPRPVGAQRSVGAQRPARRPAGDSTALDSLLSIGKRVPAWLPFGNRLVLLPQGPDG